ncbi:MAG: hypothetical protein ABEJ87_00360 [Candidatus Nanohalobium sp.]
MKHRTLVILAAVLLASGCASQTPPEERLKQLSSQASNATYKVTYEMERPGTSVIRQGLTDPVLYSYEGETMFSTSTSFIGGKALMNIYEYTEGKSITCITRKIAGAPEKSCQISNTTTSLYTEASRYADKADSINVAYLGERKFAGRKCGMFGLGIPEKQFKASSRNTGANVKLCVDKKKGYVAYIQINLTNPIRTATGKINTILQLKALNYSSKVKKSRIETGKGLVTSTSCNPLKAQVTSLGYKGKFNLSVNDANTTYSLKKAESKAFDLSNSSINGVNDVKAFYSGKVSSASCNATAG